MGLPPFYSENVDRMYELILHSELKFLGRAKVSKEAQDLIRKVKILCKLTTIVIG